MPGLGVSVAASRHYGPALRQWDEAAAGEAEAAAEESGGKQPGLGARLVRLLNLRREEVGELPPGEAGKEGGQEEERPAAGPCPRPGRCRDHQGGAGVVIPTLLLLLNWSTYLPQISTFISLKSGQI